MQLIFEAGSFHTLELKLNASRFVTSGSTTFMLLLYFHTPRVCVCVCARVIR